MALKRNFSKDLQIDSRSMERNAQNQSLMVKELKIKAIRRCHLIPVKGCYRGEYARDSVSKNKETRGGGGKKKLKRTQAHKQTN